MLTRLDSFPLFNDGHVTYLEHLGSDSGIASDARVSYKGCDALEMSDEEFSKDESLIRTLLRSSHSSPFEGTLIKWMMRIPMDVWRQFVRHRTMRYAHVNEYSTRYKNAVDSTLTTKPSEWRLQAKDNKQGSSGFLDEEIGHSLSEDERDIHQQCLIIYKDRISKGVAREQARKDLPLSTYTEVVVSCDVWNLMHFFMLRRKPDAQLEIRQVADCLYENIFRPLFPATAQAFEDYKFNAVTLSALDIKVLLESREYVSPDWASLAAMLIPSKREQAECLSKLKTILGDLS